MSHLIDQLALIVEGLKRTQASLVRKGNAMGAIEIQALIDPLIVIAVDLDDGVFETEVTGTRKRFPKSRGGKGFRKKGRRRP